MDFTLAEKVLKKTRLDLQRRFPIFHVVSQMLGAPSLRLRNPFARLKHSTWNLMRWERHRLTGNVGCPLRTDAASLKSRDSLIEMISF